MHVTSKSGAENIINQRYLLTLKIIRQKWSHYNNETKISYTDRIYLFPVRISRLNSSPCSGSGWRDAVIGCQNWIVPAGIDDVFVLKSIYDMTDRSI
jgi:hypothetical protein